MDVRLGSLLDRLNTASSALETWNEGLSFFQSIGFDRVMYGFACRAPHDPETDIRIMSNFPPDYLHHYRQQRYFMEDPVVHYCVGNLAPHLMGINSLPHWPDQGRAMNRSQRGILDEAAQCGSRTGVVFPLRSAGRYPLAGFSVSNAMGLDEFETCMADRILLAQLGALYTHTFVQMQFNDKSGKEISLTARERECLLWSASGMSSKEVARRLGVSFKTVDFHIANAMAKLNASTRSHAVARAIALGLLQP